MKAVNLTHYLANNSYPGRGILVGKSQDGTKAMIVYFIMGRSENSRNRIFVETADGIQTKAYDESKMTDPSLIIYTPVRASQESAIVTNGDQTNTIYDFLAKGKTFEDALHTRTFEPDSPNFTPRISAIAIFDGTFSYKIAILKSNNHNSASVERFFYEYTEPVNGEGHLIHTYQGDGNPIPSFEGEPVLVTIPDDIDDFAGEIWEHLDADNKVSLYGCSIDFKTGERKSRIVNKHQ